MRPLALMLLTALAPLGAVQAAPYEPLAPPLWTEGQRWSLSVKMEARTFAPLPGQEGPRLNSRGFRNIPPLPTLWMFEVAKVYRSEDGQVQRYDIKARRSGRKSEALDLRYVAQLDGAGRPYRLALQSYRVKSGKGEVFRDVRDQGLEPSPVLVRGVPVPLSWPFMGPDVPPEKVFPLTEMVGDLPYAMDIEQRVSTGDKARAQARRYGVRLADGQRVWSVEILRRTDGSFANQIWIEGAPWPARVVTNQVESTLLGRGAGG